MFLCDQKYLGKKSAWSCKHTVYVNLPEEYMHGCSDGSVTENQSSDCEQNTHRNLCVKLQGVGLETHVHTLQQTSRKSVEILPMHMNIILS